MYSVRLCAGLCRVESRVQENPCVTFVAHAGRAAGTAYFLLYKERIFAFACESGGVTGKDIRIAVKVTENTGGPIRVGSSPSKGKEKEANRLCMVVAQQLVT